MLKLLRLFTLIWLVGLFSVVFFNRVDIFRFFGITRVNVFNTSSLLLSRWRFVYYKKVDDSYVRLPFMLESGDDLGWMKDENLRYRTYFKLAMKMRGNELKGKTFEEGLFETAEAYYPMLYNLCPSSEGSGNYILKIINTTSAQQKLYKVQVIKSELPQRLSIACKNIENLSKPFVPVMEYSPASAGDVDGSFETIIPKWNEIY